MLAKIKRQFEKTQKLGVKGAAKKLFRDKIYSVDHVLILDRSLEEDYPLKKVRAKGVTARVASTMEECAPLFAAFPDRAAYFRDYIQQGCHVMYGVRDDKVEAYVWVSTQDFYDKYLYRWTFVLEQAQMYQYAGYVVPERRGSTLSLAMMNQANAHFHALGFHKTLAAVSVDNSPSMKFHSKLQYRATGAAFNTYKLFGFRWARAAEPRAEISMFPRA